MITNPALTDESGQSFITTIVQFLRTDSGGAVGSTDWPTSPPDPADFDNSALPSGTPPTKLAKILTDVETRNLGPMCLGVVDLDRPRVVPVRPYDFAGWGLDTQAAVGSCAKIWCMYVAFQLRDDLRTFIRQTPGVTKSNVPAKLKTAWLGSSVPELKNVAENGRMPRVEKIFKLSTLPDTAPTGSSAASDRNALADSFDFDDIADCGIPDLVADSKVPGATADLASTLETFHQHEYSSKLADKVDMWKQLATMSFGRRLWLTTTWSDNAAATTCIKDIGFDYILALLYGSGLHDVDARAGARLAETYAVPDTLLNAHTWPRGSALFNRISEFSYEEKGDDPHQATTVLALLRFAAALDARRLISAADSDQMLSLMRPLVWATGRRGTSMPAIGLDGKQVTDHGVPEFVDGTDSFVVLTFDKLIFADACGLTVSDGYRPFIDAAAKLGILNDLLSDVAIIKLQTTAGLTIHWAVAFVANKRRPGVKNFDINENEYGIALRDIITQWLAD